MSQRVLAQSASEILGRPVRVVGKPGAGGTVATEFVARSKPDGYKLQLFNSGSNGITVAVRDVRYSNSDFDIICGSYIQNLILVVPTNSPFNSVKDIVEAAKKEPSKLKYATSGVGTSSHLSSELLNQVAGIKTEHVPFKGGAKCYAAIVGGHVDFSIFYYGSLKGLIDAGKLKVLAQANETRASNLPKVPTFAEEGYPEMVFSVWYGVAGPKGLPKDIMEKLQDAFGKASQDKSVAKMLHKLGYTEKYMPKQEFEAFVAKEIEKFKRVVKEANIQIK
jgi:tripartite-type tricarboxylate transporter receptor subunit TctC